MKNTLRLFYNNWTYHKTGSDWCFSIHDGEYDNEEDFDEQGYFDLTHEDIVALASLFTRLAEGE